MSRYIDADVYANDMHDVRIRLDKWLAESETDEIRNRAEGSLAILVEAKLVLDKQPTVDAVEVVRCKDCEYFKSAYVNKKGFLICTASGMDITEDDFCSYGEKVTK